MIIIISNLLVNGRASHIPIRTHVYKLYYMPPRSNNVPGALKSASFPPSAEHKLVSSYPPKSKLPTEKFMQIVIYCETDRLPCCRPQFHETSLPCVATDNSKIACHVFDKITRNGTRQTVRVRRTTKSVKAVGA